MSEQQKSTNSTIGVDGLTDEQRAKAWHAWKEASRAYWAAMTPELWKEKGRFVCCREDDEAGAWALKEHTNWSIEKCRVVSGGGGIGPRPGLTPEEEQRWYEEEVASWPDWRPGSPAWVAAQTAPV